MADYRIVRLSYRQIETIKDLITKYEIDNNLRSYNKLTEEQQKEREFLLSIKTSLTN